MTGNIKKPLIITPSKLDGEKIPSDLATRRNRELMERVEVRKNEWMRLIPLEILARNATHPTLKMRLAAICAEDAQMLPCEDSAEFAEEKQKALGFANKMLTRELAAVPNSLVYSKKRHGKEK